MYVLCHRIQTIQSFSPDLEIPGEFWFWEDLFALTVAVLRTQLRWAYFKKAVSNSYSCEDVSWKGDMTAADLVMWITPKHSEKSVLPANLSEDLAVKCDSNFGNQIFAPKLSKHLEKNKPISY